MKKIRVAVCPTYHKMVESIDTEEYEFVKTGATAESLSLLMNNYADIVLAGRVLKPSEPKLQSILVREEGYSFLSDHSRMVMVKDLNRYDIYTNLDIALIKKLFSVEKVHQVDDVYESLDKGIVITSWENTDYARAEIVHVLQDSGEREPLSRRPTLYFSQAHAKEANDLKALLT